MRSFSIALALVFASTSALHADTTLFSTSFEAPTYVVGAAAGQGAIFQDSGDSGTIETSVVNTGTQAVGFFANEDNTTANFGQSLIGIDPGFTATPTDTTVDMQISAEFTSGIVGSNYDVLALFSSGGFISQLIYNDGQVTLGSNSTAVSAGVWNTYGLHLDYSTHTATAFVNGNLLGSSTFSGSITDLTAVDFGINSVGGKDAGYFDDLSVTTPSTTSPVPEPSSLALLGTGALALAGVARRRFFSRQA